VRTVSADFVLMIFRVLPTSAQATRPSAAIQIEPL